MFYCGGGADGPYDVFGKAVFDKAKSMNDAGQYFPVWGTCLGFENLAMFASDEPSTVLEGGFEADDENYKLHFLVDPAKTKIYSRLGSAALIYQD